MVLANSTENEQIFQIYCALLGNPSMCFVQQGPLSSKQLQIVLVPAIMQTAIEAYLNFKECPDDIVAKYEDARKLANLQPESPILKL